MNRMLSRGIGAAMALSLFAPAFAQSQMELNEEAAKDFAATDKKLNEIYQSLMAKISTSGQAHLRDAEKAWIDYRDRECAFETLGTVDGSVHPLVLLNCKSRLTSQRITDLEAQLNCEEGELSCGGQ